MNISYILKCCKTYDVEISFKYYKRCAIIIISKIVGDEFKKESICLSNNEINDSEKFKSTIKHLIQSLLLRFEEDQE